MSHIVDDLINNTGSQNLAEDMHEDKLRKLAADLLTGLESDLDSRSEWESKTEDYLKLAMQVVEHKSTPWPNASNIKFPILSIAAMQFNARMYPALVPGLDIVKGLPVGEDPHGSKAMQSIRVGKHMSFQLLHQMEDWEEDMDKGLFILPMVGTFFKKTYYDSIEEINRSDLILPQDLVVNFYSKSLKSAPRISHLMAMSTNEIYEQMAQGYYADIGLFDEPIKPDEGMLDRGSNPQMSPMNGSIEAHIDEVQGFTEPSMVDNTMPHDVVEMHCWLDLDEDYYEEPYIVTIHRETQKILRITARYQSEGVLVTETEEGEQELLKIIPDEYFTSFRFMHDPQSGVYGIGFGTLLGPINHAVNTLINQLVDSGTLSNLQSGFISPGVKVKGGIFRFKPGEWKLAQIVGDNINNKIMPLPVREPSNVLFLLLGTLTKEAEKMASTMDIMTGEMPGQNTKATVALQAVEQGSKVFKAVSKRLYRAFDKELKKLYKLNSIYLDDNTYFNVLDTAQSKPAPIASDDYDLKTVDIMPSSDPTISSQQQMIAKVQAMEIGLQLGTVNPTEFTKRMAEATEQPDIDKLMDVPPPPPNPEFELEKAVKMAELELEERRVQIEELKAQASAQKDQGAYLESLAEIGEKVRDGNLAEAQHKIDEQQAKFDNLISIDERKQANKESTEAAKAKSTKEAK